MKRNNMKEPRFDICNRHISITLWSAIVIAGCNCIWSAIPVVLLCMIVGLSDPKEKEARRTHSAFVHPACLRELMRCRRCLVKSFEADSRSEKAYWADLKLGKIELSPERAALRPRWMI